MSIEKLTRSTTTVMMLVVCLSSAAAHAEPNQQSGKRCGPPHEAIEVCADVIEGAPCSFSGRRGGEVVGSCIVPPRGEEELVCAPEGGPPKHHDEK